VTVSGFSVERDFHFYGQGDWSMSNAERIPRQLIGFFALVSMFSCLILPIGVGEKRVFAEPNKSKSEIKNIENKSPLYFEANQGQLDKRVRFSANGSGYKLFLTSSEAVYVIPERKAEEAQNPKAEFEPSTIQTPKSSRAVAVWMKLSGANQNAEAEGVGELAGKHNYFKGNDQSKWQSNVPLYQKARFDNVYQGVDTEWHGNATGGIEYDFQVSPNVSTQQIEWQIEGADKVTVQPDGSLLISTSFGEIKQNAPMTYQEIDGLRSTVESRFELRGENRVGFAVGDYDRSKPLTIDPASDLVFSTFLGGEAGERSRSIAMSDFDNGVYVTGDTESTVFPTTVGVFNNSNNGSTDVFVTKLNDDASALIYSTYIGGGGSDLGNAIAVDTSGNAYITGNTVDSGTPFPTTVNAPFPANSGSNDAFVTKLNADGSALVYSTFLGGTGSDSGNGISVRSNKAYVTGNTNSSDFPTTPGAFDTTSNNNLDIFVTRLAVNGASIEYSTFIGSAGNDIGKGIAVDAQGNAFICGYSEGLFYPTTPGAFDTTHGSGADVVVTKLNSSGSALIFSTFLGGNYADFGYGIAVDPAGNAFVTGQTFGFPPGEVSFPTTVGAFDTTPGGTNSDAFVTKLNAAGSALVYSTFLGGYEDIGYGIAVNSAGNAFVVGATGSISFPTTAAAYDTTYNGDLDVFFTKLTANGSALIYSTFVGGSSEDRGLKIALNTEGEAFMSGQTYDGTIDFPTTAETVQPSFNGGITDAFVCKFAATPNVPIARAPFDFDGDGKTDISIFRPPVGEWWYMKSSNGGNAAAQFGQSTDKITPGDFSGDGKTDIAFFRPSTGFWYVLRSEDFSFYSFPFGTNGDIPAPADYDGDDKADAAIFRPSEANWYISKSTGGTLIRQFGANGDAPVPADYDGDGRADIAIFRPSVGQWWVNRSSNDSSFALQFGASTDKPVPGDYTGDGKDDIAFWQPSSGFWFVLRSENLSFFSFPFGTNGDVPAPGDYDGDGKFDASIFRPSSNTWYIQRSTAGTLIQTFGQNGDRPVPNAFVP
jgi:hypothetical protein